MTTRREFLLRSAAAVVGLGSLRLVSGCEETIIDTKIEGGAFDFITRAEDWYWQSGNRTEQEKAGDFAGQNKWNLDLISTDGSSELINFERLKAFEEDNSDLPMTYVKTMRCVFGVPYGPIADTLISTGIFTGIPLPVVLNEFDVATPEATKLRSFGEDGFKSNITKERALNQGDFELPPMLAYQLNGRPLPAERGGPVRLIIPEMWGYKNMKWLRRLEFTENDSPFGLYEEENFPESHAAHEIIDNPAEISLLTHVTDPVEKEGAEIEGPDVTIQGTSVVGGARITDVEVSLDGGPYESVKIQSRNEVQASESLTDDAQRALADAENFQGEWPPKNAWSIWSKTFEGLSTGQHEVVVRARDSRDRRQPNYDSDIGTSDEQFFKTEPGVKVQFEVT